MRITPAHMLAALYDLRARAFDRALRAYAAHLDVPEEQLFLAVQFINAKGKAFPAALPQNLATSYVRRILPIVGDVPGFVIYDVGEERVDAPEDATDPSQQTAMGVALASLLRDALEDYYPTYRVAGREPLFLRAHDLTSAIAGASTLVSNGKQAAKEATDVSALLSQSETVPLADLLPWSDSAITMIESLASNPEDDNPGHDPGPGLWVNLTTGSKMYKSRMAVTMGMALSATRRVYYHDLDEPRDTIYGFGWGAGGLPEIYEIAARMCVSPRGGLKAPIATIIDSASSEFIFGEGAMSEGAPRGPLKPLAFLNNMLADAGQIMILNIGVTLSKIDAYLLYINMFVGRVQFLISGRVPDWAEDDGYHGDATAIAGTNQPMNTFGVAIKEHGQERNRSRQVERRDQWRRKTHQGGSLLRGKTTTEPLEHDITIEGRRILGRTGFPLSVCAADLDMVEDVVGRDLPIKPLPPLLTGSFIQLDRRDNEECALIGADPTPRT